MGFAERYIRALNSSDLRDDARHTMTDALAASAVADGDSGIGSLLCRVKDGDGSINQEFEGNPQNLAQLIRIWAMLVAQKGRARQWVKIKAEWDIPMANALYQRVAEQSMMQWLDGRCKPCKGAGVDITQHDCPRCGGTGKTQLPDTFDGRLARGMVGELEELTLSHSQRGAYLMRGA